MSAVADVAAPRAGSAAVARIWRDNGVKRSTIRVYLYWIHRFEVDCARREVDAVSKLTLVEATKFAQFYAEQYFAVFLVGVVRPFCGSR